jgi:hypothetical protein
MAVILFCLMWGFFCLHVSCECGSTAFYICMFLITPPPWISRQWKSSKVCCEFALSLPPYPVGVYQYLPLNIFLGVHWPACGFLC